MPPIKSDSASRHLGAGLTMAVVVGLFSYGGHWLDTATGTSPLFLLVGLALGFAGGFLHLLVAVAPEMLPSGLKKRRGRGVPPERENGD